MEFEEFEWEEPAASSIDGFARGTMDSYTDGIATDLGKGRSN